MPVYRGASAIHCCWKSDLLTLLQANSHVYVDIAGLIWSYPIKEVNRHI
jgi:hypothetical protein